MNGSVLMKLIHMKLLILRSLGQRSRSASDGHINLVNSTAAEPMKRFVNAKLQILPTVRPQTDYVFKVMGSKVKVIENTVEKGRRHTDRWLAVDFCL